MKKLLTFAMLLIPIITFSNDDVVKFLGIPVDGNKFEMIRKLNTKGFSSVPFVEDVMEGQFNGRNVKVHILHNKAKVWKIAVIYYSDADISTIINVWNRLYRQFKNKIDYTYVSGQELSPYRDAKTITKSAHAMFIQGNENEVYDKIEPYLFQAYSEQQLGKPDDSEALARYEKLALLSYAQYSGNGVSISIAENQGEYTIIIHYENGKNAANGEDL